MPLHTGILHYQRYTIALAGCGADWVDAGGQLAPMKAKSIGALTKAMTPNENSR